MYSLFYVPHSNTFYQKNNNGCSDPNIYDGFYSTLR